MAQQEQDSHESRILQLKINQNYLDKTAQTRQYLNPTFFSFFFSISNLIRGISRQIQISESGCKSFGKFWPNLKAPIPLIFCPDFCHNFVSAGHSRANFMATKHPGAFWAHKILTVQNFSDIFIPPNQYSHSDSYNIPTKTSFDVKYLNIKTKKKWNIEHIILVKTGMKFKN